MRYHSLPRGPACQGVPNIERAETDRPATKGTSSKAPESLLTHSWQVAQLPASSLKAPQEWVGSTVSAFGPVPMCVDQRLSCRVEQWHKQGLWSTAVRLLDRTPDSLHWLHSQMARRTPMP